jgi:NADH-quinone oxidoreductase subunit J
MVYGAWAFVPEVAGNLAAPVLKFEGDSNSLALGQLIYTHYILAFQLAGLVLFVAMIGSIVLTLRSRPGVRRQKISDQVSRRPEDAMEIQKVSSGSGA